MNPMFLQANIYYDEEKENKIKEQLLSYSVRNGRELAENIKSLYEQLKKLYKKEIAIYIDNAFSQIFAITCDLIKLEWIKIDEICDIIFNLSPIKGCHVVAFLITTKNIDPQFYYEEKELLKKFYSSNEFDYQDQNQKKTGLSISIQDYKNQNKKLLEQQLIKQNEIVYSLMITSNNQNTNRFLTTNNIISILSNFIIQSADIYVLNLTWTWIGEPQPKQSQLRQRSQKLDSNSFKIKIIQSDKLPQTSTRYLTKLELTFANSVKLQESELLLIFNNSKIVFEYPLQRIDG